MLRQRHDEVMNACNSSHMFNFFLLRFLIPKTDVVSNGVREQLRFLEHVRDLFAQASYIKLVDIDVIDPYDPFAHNVIPRYQIR